MYRLVPCLAALAILSLPACKRDRGPSEPEDPGSHPSSPTPTPEQVCTHLSNMIAIELGGVDPGVQRETIATCTVEMTSEQQMRGPEAWDAVARCVVAAQNEADIDRCDQLYPPVAAGSGPSNPEATKEDQVCVVMVSNFAIELVAEAEAAGRPPPELADDDIRNAHAECLRSLEAARQVRTGTDYDQLLDCLGAADSGVAMEQCLN